MAEKPKTAEKERKGKSFKADASKFDSIVVGQEIRGIFMNCATQEIRDKRTRQMKDVLVFKLRQPDNGDKVVKLPLASMLERAWEDLCDEYGNSDHKTTVEYLRGRELSIIRGQDSRTSDGNQLGTYEIIVWD